MAKRHFCFLGVRKGLLWGSSWEQGKWMYSSWKRNLGVRCSRRRRKATEVWNWWVVRKTRVDHPHAGWSIACLGEDKAKRQIEKCWGGVRCEEHWAGGETWCKFGFYVFISDLWGLESTLREVKQKTRKRMYCGRREWVQHLAKLPY